MSETIHGLLGCDVIVLLSQPDTFNGPASYVREQALEFFYARQLGVIVDWDVEVIPRRGDILVRTSAPCRCSCNHNLARDMA